MLSFIRENLRWLLGGFMLTFFSSFGQTFFISLSGAEIRAEYGLSNGGFGMLYMAATLASAVILPFVGRLVDIVPVATTALIITPLLALACVSMAFSNSLVILVITIFALRLFGQGMMTHTSMTAMGRWYKGHRGRAISLATLGHQAGESILPITAVALFSVVGWRTGWLYGAAVLVLVALPAIWFSMRVEREPRATDKPENHGGTKSWTRAEVMRDPLFWLTMLAVLAPAFIGTTIYFHQAYLVELRNWPAALFVSSYVIMSSMTVLFSLIGGWLIDLYSAKRLLPVFLVPLGLACMVLSTIGATYAIFFFMALLGISYGLSSTLFGAIWPELYGVNHLGSIRSVTVSMMVLGSALGPGLTGLLIDWHIAYDNQIFTMGIYCFFVSFLMILVSRRYVARII